MQYLFYKNSIFYRKFVEIHYKMSKNYIMFLFLSILAISISVPSAGLPTLPPDSKIKAGTLGNGISYYIVANSQGTGKVDIALVQKVEGLMRIKKMQERP